MTEDEARKKECRAAGGFTEAQAGRYFLWPYCSASDCMHWVEEFAPLEIKGGKLTIEYDPDSTAKPEPIGGHCGLAK